MHVCRIEHDIFLSFLFLKFIRALDKREYLVIIRDIFLIILHKNICCDPLSEPSHQDVLDEGSQHMVWMRISNKKNYHQILPLN